MNKVLVFFVAAFAIAANSFAADLWWDTNGTTDGASAGTTAGGALTAANFWNSDSTGGSAGALSTWVNANNDVAHFSAGTNATGSSTVTGNITVGGIAIEEGTVAFSGNITAGASPITVASGASLSVPTSTGTLGILTTAGSTITLNGGTLQQTNTGSAGTFFDTDTEIILGTGGGTLSYITANSLSIAQTATKITGTGSLTKVGAGVLAIASTAGNNTYSGGTFVNEGELRMRTVTNTLPTSTAVTVASPGIFNLNAVSTQIGSLAGNGSVGLAGATLTVNGTTNTTFSGVIAVTANAGASGSTALGGNLTKSGASTLTLTGANTYTGTTTMSNAGATISVGDGGTTGSIAGNAAVNNATAVLVFNRSDDISYAGVVSGVGQVRKEGAGVLTLSNATNEWTSTGAVTINGGAIKLGTSATGFANTTPVVINAGGTFDMNNINDTFGSLAGSGPVQQGIGNIGLAAATGTTTYSGTITGTGSLTKGRTLPTGVTDISTQILSGNNTTGNVIVNAGAFLLNGTNTTGTVTVNGGVLGGTGSVSGAVTVETGGRIAAGTGAANATFSAPIVTLNTGSILKSTLGAGGSPLGSSDVLNVADNGGFTLNGSTLEIATANGVTNGTYRLVKYNGTLGGAFGNLTNSSQAGFDNISLVNNTAESAIDVSIVITERNWVADGSGDWSNGGNWGSNPTQPNAIGAIANFIATTPTNGPHTVTLDDADKTVGVVNLNNSSSYTIAGTNRLIIDTWGADGVINDAAGSHTISAPVQLNKTTNMGVTGVGDTLTASGIVSGTGGIIKSGAGKLLLTGVNTYTGGNTVSAGTLEGDSGSIKGAIANNGSVVFNQTTNGSYGGAISGSGTVTKNGAGTLSLTVNNTYTGGYFFNAGGIAVNSASALGAANSPVSIGNNVTFSTTAGTARTLTYAFTANGDFTLHQVVGTTAAISLGGTLDLGGATRTVTSDDGTNNISAVISNGGLIKMGAGILGLTSATGSTYTGNTTLSQGTLQLNGTGTFGNNVNATAGTLNLAGGTLNTTASRAASTAPIANPINMTADTLVTTTSTATTVELNFSNDNIVATAGTLTFRNVGADGSGDTFQPRFSGNFNFSRPIVVDNGATGKTKLMSFNTGGSQVFSGEISGSGSYNRSASTATTGGTTEFTAANLYTGGTTVNDGTLKVNNTTGSGTGSGPVTVGVGTAATLFRGTLAGTGSVDGLITVQEGGNIAPGNSIGTLTAAGGLTLQANSVLTMDLGAPTAADLINVLPADGLTINGGSVNFVNAGGLAAGDYTLIDYNGNIGGAFANLTLGVTQPANFNFVLDNDTTNTKIVVHVTSTGPVGVPGDYNNNNVVDAADYVLWRNNGPIQNEVAGVTPGSVTPEDYDAWRARFGNTSGSGSGQNAAVPEPSSLVLLTLVACLLKWRQRS